ncbi:MAG TPA: PKD domain-containing protein [Vicinamibacterales bacterium]|nr:PKD domain-containing protein [Vicinamibacterales bacterium]
MRSPVSRIISFSVIATLALLSCSRDMPLQPLRPDVVVGGLDADSLPPSNDFRDSARFAFPLPYTDTLDLTFATIEAGEPTSFCHDSVTPPSRSVWYVMTQHQPGGGSLTAQVHSGPGVLTVYRDSVGALIPIVCSAFNQPITFFGDSGTTFWYQVTDSAGAGGFAVFTLQGDTLPPPPPPDDNDFFANARPIPGVPYSDTVFFAGATREFNEPAFCAFQQQTRWYRFTAMQTRALQYGLTSTPFFDNVTVYQGTSLNNLSFVGCANSFSPGTFTAFAGQTYYFQVSSDQSDGAVFFLNVPPPPPPPQANFSTFPFDPSLFDNVQFFDQSFDPGNVGIGTRIWSFGDGAVDSTTSFVTTHQYAADGDYPVSLQVTTLDGRTGSITRTLPVRTHDVAITKFQTPSSGGVGRSTKISVDIRSNRYAETVDVQLFKSVPGGYQFVAVSRQTLPTRNRVTSVGFTYTFAPSDAVIGKVTFRVLVSILGARDALPADNEAIGSPTKVR